jgi:transposase
MASVALARGINANLLRRWVRDAEVLPTRALKHASPAAPAFVPVPLPDVAAPMGEIRIDAMWMAVEPVDMRAGADRLLARVVQVFGAARAHHGYIFANARGTRIKLLVHDGFGVPQTRPRCRSVPSGSQTCI